MSLELLRNRWTYAVLVALRSGSLRPAQLLDLINEGNVRNVDLVGARVLHEKTLFTTLHRMEAEGLIIRKTKALANGAAPWELTLMSRGLLDAMDGIAAWARDHVDHLTITVRKHRGLSQRGVDTATSEPPPLSPEQDYWRGAGLALVMLRLRWSFSIICQMSKGPQHPTGIAAAINAGIERNRDITGRRALSEKVLWDTLHRLVDGGLIDHRPRAAQFASTARCTLTAPGYALLAALVPIGVWASEHEEHLAAIIRRRRGLDDLLEPRDARA
ncbi:winged helix-turn-helix transcriptional regulator [Streptomyces aurantiacus]|uniref:winged helix-turn-helix transcriptional regulator n=1 Tax=Streptomyces aurantiacus TaxID=47760 RepID=UPI0027D86FA5|nr:hypothetical protein [Streptomyces aurantiacus]